VVAPQAAGGSVVGAAVSWTRLIKAEDGDVGSEPLLLEHPLVVLPHCPHHRAPADAEVGGDPGDVGGVLTDAAGAFGPGAFGQHRPWADRRAGL
jgi:hypothetical protein